MQPTINDIKSPKWINLILLLQQIARTRHLNHHKMLRVTVVVDETGNPILWTEPECSRIDPMNAARDWLNRL